MLRFSFLLRIVSLFLAASVPLRLAGQVQTRVDYVVLIDISGSMAGRPEGSGNVNIFPQVQQAVGQFISELEPGSHVFITPFAETLGATRRFEIGGPGSAQEAIAYVNSLQATGSETHVYGAMRDVFARYNDFRRAQDDRVGVLMVFTDGLDNGPEGLSMRDVVQQFGLQRKENDFIYYATLGVNLPPEEAAALVGSGFGAHDPSPRGDVHPVRIVQPRYALLSFGNLQRNPQSQRQLRLDVRGQLPPEFRLGTSTQFPQLAERGIYVEVSPKRVAVQEEVRLGLTLVNAEGIPTGDYEGVIQLESSDPQVIVVPRQIRARFTYAPPRTARMLAPPGRERLELALGRVDPWRAREGRDAAGDSLRLDLDREAAARGGNFGVRVRQDARNPSVLPAQALRVNGVAGEMHNVDAAARRLAFGVEVDRNQVKPGTYRGTLLLEDGSVELQGAREVPWTFVVARPPLGPGAVAGLVLAALAALAVLALLAMRWLAVGPFKPLLRGRLTLRAPSDVFGEEIVLTGKRHVLLGSGTDQLPRASARVRIVPEQSRSHFRIKLVAEEGNVQIRRPGEPYDTPVAIEPLQDGDVITLAPYRIEYSRL
ncbi:MAG TPA: VWA domain-containing protein [Longimicrobium sp.]|nr:VWA domain-containing protein [Longimicrobium sp.]